MWDQGLEQEWAELMRMALAGDSAAYRQFLLCITPHLRAMARSRCRALGAPDSETEDIVQEVLLAIHLKRGSWDSSRPIGPWIGAIVRNKIIDALRRRGRRTNVPIEDVMDTLAAEEQAGGLVQLDIDSHLATLKRRQQDIVRSISIDGDSIRETANRFKMTEGAVRVALHRALKSLAQLCRIQST
ncbi:RNA polymerase subunit sigma [Azospirillum sp. TSA6c]|uniref:sigma-70 family RNA polymerase sigma factor n=2 Tax=unclassified Azospirillum TaxID=2630922 RepID=UPI000D619D63|nr:sigma-70 family RNA polymerase sigma factor [Azospirillum sp. TSA6c]PWC47346.1 RNA polymerase subunit sigma [Azospirillum sp. TSA6c]PWC54041.1 RNA polymerase subunit sigma [Azospirillum sp. TSA6c]